MPEMHRKADNHNRQENDVSEGFIHCYSVTIFETGLQITLFTLFLKVC